MPRGNGMGPMGQGSMTGRGAGFCAGYQVPGCVNHANPGFGRGFGRGFGAGYRHGNGQGAGGRGFGFLQRFRGAMPTEIPTELTVESEKAFLKNRVEILARELENANTRLAELDAAKES